MWVARDKEYNDLFLYITKPIKDEKAGYWVDDDNNPETITDNNHFGLPNEMFPELKWEDEPIKVELVSNDYLTRVCKDPCINCFNDYPLCTANCKKYQEYVDSKK